MSQIITSSLVSRLADAVEFQSAAMDRMRDQSKELSGSLRTLMEDQNKRLWSRASALLKDLDGEAIERAFDFAEGEIAHRKALRKFKLDRKRRAREEREALEADGAFA